MKLGIGICSSQEKVHTSFFWSMLLMKKAFPHMYFPGLSPWDDVRNNSIIEGFLQSDCTHFVKMDTDQIYPRNYFDKMVPLAENHDVIGPMIFDRHKQSGFMPLCKNDDGPGESPFWPPEKAHDGKTGIEEVPYLHTNCFYNRKVLESLKRPWYEAKISRDGLKRTNHLDYSFMMKIKDKGFRVYINNDVTVEHIASVPINREFHEKYAGKS